MESSSPRLAPLELWGGVECTVNRVYSEYFDQLERTGHASRPDDLELFADLGLRAIRYPVLWERTAPRGIEDADWTWADERLNRLRELKIEPIVGLVHHGNGPPYTSLLDPEFPEKLAVYAAGVAQRYPWIRRYIPINEPLTTARFCGLYGVWYPHGRDSRTFIRTLLAQCKAVVLAMRAIRQVRPDAQLIQNDDIARCFSTPALEYEATFQNQRRWLTFDLLCGRVNAEHPLGQYLIDAEASERELAWFLDNSCPPDMIGFDHYLSSERYLDEHLDRYPPHCHGGNSRDRYADVEAIRVRAEGPAGMQALLQETWERYGIPLVMAEVHNGCTREEQMRWFLESWRSAEAARQSGVDIRAVTAWALLGLYDWNTLCTRTSNHYEPGVFDLRSVPARPTAMAGLLRALSAGEKPSHPVLRIPGWWRRPDRFIFGHAVEDSGRTLTVAPDAVAMCDPAYDAVDPLLIVGVSGPIGQTAASMCEIRGIPYHTLDPDQLKLQDENAATEIVGSFHPWAVLYAAESVDSDRTECDLIDAHRVYTSLPGALASACAAAGARLLLFSSHLVFGGRQRVPYREGDPVDPICAAGRARADGESLVARALPHSLIVRSGPLLGVWNEANFVSLVLQTVAEGDSVVAADDVVVSPTYVPDLVQNALDLLIDGESGVWHLAHRGSVSWADLARRVVQEAGLDHTLVHGSSSRTESAVPSHPVYRVLGSERGLLLSSLDEALARALAERPAPRQRARHEAGVKTMDYSLP